MTEPLLTESDLRALPDDGYRYELRAGLLLKDAGPSFDHGESRNHIGSLLREFVLSKGLGRVVTKAGFILARRPDTVRIPDVAFVSAKRFAATPPRRGGFLEGAPDLAVEILSPTNRREEIRAKIGEYLDAGATLVWIVDPSNDSVTVHRPRAGPRRLGRIDTLDGEDVLPGFSIAVASLFRD